MSATTILSGKLPTDLANVVSDALHEAQEKGMDLDEAVCVTMAVAADYARERYGDGYLVALCDVVMSRFGKPLPENVATVQQ